MPPAPYLLSGVLAPKACEDACCVPRVPTLRHKHDDEGPAHAPLTKRHNAASSNAQNGLSNMNARECRDAERPAGLARLRAVLEALCLSEISLGYWQVRAVSARGQRACLRDGRRGHNQAKWGK